MEELIFFAVIILFSILESVARSRRAKQREAEGEGGPPLPDTRDWEPKLPDLERPRPVGGARSGAGDRLPTYDEEPSYDEGPSYDDKVQEGSGRVPLERYTAPHGTDRPVGQGRAGGDRPSSQTMLPGDLLEQLETLARGRKAEREKGRTVDLPRQSPPIPSRRPPLERTEVGSGRKRTPGSTAPVGSRTPIGATPVEHRVHRSHAGYGTDPSSRAPSEQDHLDPLAERLGAEGVAVRRQLRGGRAGLRQAMVLKEVLGPPLALRGEGRTGP
jgi:hypothetical protein